AASRRFCSMRPLTSQLSASVARRCQVVKKTCVGAAPRSAELVADPSSRSAAIGSMRGARALGLRERPETPQPRARGPAARLPPLIPVTPTTRARPGASDRPRLSGGLCAIGLTRRSSTHLAIDDGRRDDEQALEDVLPLLIETEEDGGVEHL